MVGHTLKYPVLTSMVPVKANYTITSYRANFPRTDET